MPDTLQIVKIQRPRDLAHSSLDDLVDSVIRHEIPLLLDGLSACMRGVLRWPARTIPIGSEQAVTLARVASPGGQTDRIGNVGRAKQCPGVSR
ncbi:hypothetical protein [Xanthomonas oryzae]|uniref:hypothetical protein n=1 Tax=Xanthomonas oryzae TaxID=347 RepID=UPI0013923D0F|nr:hypothetical protein [Xanthomonas oryzae]